LLLFLNEGDSLNFNVQTLDGLPALLALVKYADL